MYPGLEPVSWYTPLRTNLYIFLIMKRIRAKPGLAVVWITNKYLNQMLYIKSDVFLIYLNLTSLTDLIRRFNYDWIYDLGIKVTIQY